MFAFYDSARSIPQFWRDVERFSGNIRAGMFEDSLDGLIESGNRAVAHAAATLRQALAG